MKKNIEEVKNEFIKRGYIPLFDTYKNNKEKLKFKNKNGYIGNISLNKINNIDNYLYFSIFNENVIDNINTYCREHRLMCEVYPQEYKGIDYHMRARCLICGKDFYTTWHIISDKRYNKYKKCCKYCSNKLTHMNDLSKYSFSEVYNIFKSNGLLLLDSEYVNNTIKMDCEDAEGYRGNLSFHQLLSGRMFNKFHKSNPYSIYNLNLFFEINNCKTKLLDKEYRGNKYNYNFKCECGNIFKRSIDSVVYNGSLYCLDCTKHRKSSYHLKVRDWLDDNNINYIEEYTFDNCKDLNKLPFDFYLLDYNLCIEVQGEQHYTPKDIFGGINGFEKIISHSIIKKYYCNCNNICFVKIDYSDFTNDNYIYILLHSIKTNDFNKI